MLLKLSITTVSVHHKQHCVGVFVFLCYTHNRKLTVVNNVYGPVRLDTCTELMVCVCVWVRVYSHRMCTNSKRLKKKKDQDASSSFQDKHLFKYMMRSRTVVLITAWCHSYQNKTETKRQTDQLILICTNYDSGFPHQWCHQSTAYCKCIFIMGPARNKTSVLEYS